VPSISPADYWRTNAAISLFWFTLAGTAVPYLIFYFLLAQGRLAPVQVAVSQWIQVLFAVAESAYFMRAFPSWEMLAAVATLVVCVWMLLRRDRDSSPVSIVLRDTPL
jgi:drug/metabolite transporter (DMT)-like permease